MTTNKPEVVAYHHINKENPEHRGVSLHHDESCASTLISTEPLIRLSDYEALQAECDALVEALTTARETIASALRANAPDYFTTDADIARHVDIQRIDTALAAHSKQGDQP